MQRKIYQNILSKKSPYHSDTATALNNILMQLRKVCLHPYLFEGIEDPTMPALGEHLISNSGKMIILDKILQRLHSGHKVLIFSQFTSMLDIMEDYLQYRNWSYCRFDGTSDMQFREE